ncbi:replication/maintenance protein RepL [Ferdinandcohnia quinoae]|uniref:Type IV toxin-antitoxin system AbiEi family antitoxin domain-containing protein n=1 Tax=Fredinandcohnia quinoae TaxID=2918902 RepID=A0AAW5E0I7_9BACI|nr:type IV toxin-antitoxin system AbiEi family antitoxin domain-containing protein [Fredinandcohnia sp. SECRCQ15]MCH1626123.1 type IV toxin-antitoxin system AbiEi family antitoxin domain-containing protein [Fredinandcohnia sp. SECRCQ15]
MKNSTEFEQSKDYLEDLLLLHGVPKNLALLLFELLSYVNKDNQIVINAFIKKELAEKAKISKGTIDNALTKLKDSGLLERLDRGVYIPHSTLLKVPKLIKGNAVSFKVTYSKNKKEIEPI